MEKIQVDTTDNENDKLYKVVIKNVDDDTVIKVVLFKTKEEAEAYAMKRTSEASFEYLKSVFGI